MTESNPQGWLSWLSRGRLGSQDQTVAVPARSPPIPKGLGLHRICDPIDALVEYGRNPLVAFQISHEADEHWIVLFLYTD